MKDTIKALMENKEFLEKAVSIKDIDELAKHFAANGVDEPIEKISEALGEYTRSLGINETEFSEQELEMVSGGADNEIALMVFGFIACCWNCSFGILTNTTMAQRGRR